MLAHSIQQLDKYEVTVELDDDVTATISVWVVPIREPGEEEAAPVADALADDEIAGQASIDSNNMVDSTDTVISIDNSIQ